MVPEPDRPVRSDAEWLDELYSVLADRRRRFVLFELCEHDGSMSLQTLVNRTVEWEALSATDAVDRRRIETSLRHVHIPKLVRAGIVAFDEAAQTVTFLGQGSRAEVVRRVAISLARH